MTSEIGPEPAAVRPGVGFVEPVECVKRLRQDPCRARQEDRLAQLQVQPPPFRSELGCSSGISGPELDPGEANSENLYAIPFEVSSLLLLAALFGAIVLAKSDREPAPEVPPLAVVEERVDEYEGLKV